jgi:integrase
MSDDKTFSFTMKRLADLPAPSAGRIWYHDSKVRGLALRVTATGAKAFYLYRKFAGRPAQVRLGGFPEISVDQARDLADELNGQIARGVSPQEAIRAKQARRDEPTMGELWEHWLVYAKGHKRPRSVAEDERQWKAYLKTRWSARRLSTIKKTDVQALHARLGQKHGRYMANRTLALLRSMFNRADGLGWRGENPAKGIKKFSEESRDRFLQSEELPKFFEALAKEPNPVIQGFFLMCLFTGARRRNVEQMRWIDVSFDLKQWRIPDTKGGMSVIVPLVDPALQVLEQLRVHAKPGNPWVFPGRRKGKHLTDPMAAWRRILADAGLSDLRIHDLRRSLGSWQALTGASLPVIGKSLGHLRQETTAIYARLTLDPVREAVEKATAKMLGFQETKPDATNTEATGPDEQRYTGHP